MCKSLTITNEQDTWSRAQLAALSQLGVQNAQQADLAVFLHQCQRTGLDPFSRQIYLIERRQKQGNEYVSKQTIQVGIDGFRLIAAARRTGTMNCSANRKPSGAERMASGMTCGSPRPLRSRRKSPSVEEKASSPAWPSTGNTSEPVTTRISTGRSPPACGPRNR